MKKVLIFGGTGQVGTHLVRKLTKNNYRVTVITRNIHEKGHKIKIMGNAGYIDLVEASIFEEKKIRNLFENADICINLIGILFEKKKGSNFSNVHSVFPSLLARLCKEYKLSHFIHLSALGIDEASDSKYAMSKIEGEKRIIKYFPLATILRPSIVYSSSDNFTCNFMTLLNRLPVFPLYYSGNTKFTPIHCSDLTDIIYYIISKKLHPNIVECVGPEVFTFKEILEKLLELIGKKRFLIPLPLSFANVSASIFELLPEPLITRDQIKLLKYDNVITRKYKTNSDIGIPSKRFFYDEVKKYCYMWKDGGQFSTIKYNNKKIK